MPSGCPYIRQNLNTRPLVSFCHGSLFSRCPLSIQHPNMHTLTPAIRIHSIFSTSPGSINPEPQTLCCRPPAGPPSFLGGGGPPPCLATYTCFTLAASRATASFAPPRPPPFPADGRSPLPGLGPPLLCWKLCPDAPPRCGPCAETGLFCSFCCG
jgi:hypothetical protein